MRFLCVILLTSISAFCGVGTLYIGGAFPPNNNLPLFQSRLSGASTNVIRVTVFGDSIGCGAYAANSWETNGWIGRLRRNLQSSYGNAGTGFVPSWKYIYLAYTNDSFRYYPSNSAGSILSPWAYVDSDAKFGGPFNKAVYCNGWSTQYVSLTPLQSFTHFDVIWATTPSTDGGTSNAVVYVDGVQATNFAVTSTSTPTWAKLRVNAPGTNIVLYPPGSGQFVFIGIDLRSATNGVLVDNISVSGNCVTNLLQTINGGGASWSNQMRWQTNFNLFYTAFDPALTVLAMDVNDYRYQTDLTTYSNSIYYVFQSATNGSRMVLGCNNRDPSSFSWTIAQSEYQSVGSNFGFGFYSMATRWGSWATANGLGYMYDVVHPTDSGHADYASAVESYILP